MKIYAWVLMLALPLLAQQAAEKPLYVVTFVDVYPNFSADAAKALQDFAAESRKAAGSVRFEVLRDVERANHLTVLEVWMTRQAFEAHLTAPYARVFREKLQPMLGSPFDERLHYLAP